MDAHIITQLGTLYHGDCFDVMQALEAHSVDLILTDLPYGITSRCKWDVKLPLKDLWQAFIRLLRDPKSAVVLTATQPFASELICTCAAPLKFRYELIWQKNARDWIP